jgi:hypothetical protein
MKSSGAGANSIPLSGKMPDNLYILSSLEGFFSAIKSNNIKK